MVDFNNSWNELLKEEFEKEYYINLRRFLKEEYSKATIYPSMYDIFNTLKTTSIEELRVVMVGQDPYINPGEAHGFAFSVLPGVRTPPSLQNIYKELETDLGCRIPNNGNLMHWAKQGILLLNSVLTVRRGASKSHAGKGWEQFTDSVLKIINQRDAPVVCMLWGRDAQQKGALLNNPKHLILKAAHPSPLARGYFFGCRHFSKANEFLTSNGLDAIDWQIPDI